VYSLETLIALVLVALVIGLIAGAIVTQRIAPSKQSQKDMEKHLEDLQQQQKSYQQEVVEHFSQTGQLLNQLTASYRDVHEHLANGAQLLADQKAGDAIGVLPSNEDTKSEATEDHNLMPPLDYAPKSTPYEKGMLNETFGLEDAKPTEETPPEFSATGTDNHN
jgi:uncharacterized protein